MKKKLRMDLKELRVESFEAVKEKEEHGTVHGHGSWGCSVTCYSCGPQTCGGNTCQFESCDGVCDTWLCTP
jgi:hypothetical protein